MKINIVFLMNVYMRRHWFLFTTICVFIILKIPHLSYPFLRDESWPYASGINTMYRDGISLMPGAISGELSRGHPLMFHFLVSSWMNIFGSSHFAMHSYSLFVAIMLLVLIYFTGYRLFNKNVAVIALVLIAFQQMYFIQSAMLFLEIQLSLFCFCSIVSYIRQQYLLLSIFLTLAYLTKESGIVVGLVLGIDTLFALFLKSLTFKDRIKQIVALLVPLLFIGVFFILQKMENGWYILPLYSSEQGFIKDIRTFYFGFRESIDVVFYNDGRNVYYLLLLASTLVIALVKRKFFYLFLVVPYVLAWLMYYNYFFILPDYALVICFVLSFVVIGYKLSKYIADTNVVIRKYLLLSFGFVLTFILYSSVFSVLITRYLTPILVVMLFISAVLFEHFLKLLNTKYAIPVLILSIVCAQAYGYKRDFYIGDTNSGVFDAMYVEVEAMKYMDSHNYFDNCISVFGFMQWLHLQDSTTGFRFNSKPYKKVVWGIGECADVIMLENLEFGPILDTSMKCRADTNYVLAHRAERGVSWSEIFIRKEIYNTSK